MVSKCCRSVAGCVCCTFEMHIFEYIFTVVDDEACLRSVVYAVSCACIVIHYNASLLYCQGNMITEFSNYSAIDI